MDVLQGGSDRPGWAERAGRRLPAGPGRPWRRLLRASPPRWAVTAVAVASLATAASGAAALAPVGAAEDREADRLDVAVLGAGGSTEFRPLGPATGTLVLDVVNRRDRAVAVRGLALDVPGVQVLDVVPELPTGVRRGQPVQLLVAFAVPDCRALQVRGSLLLRVAPDGRPEQVLRVPVQVPQEPTPQDAGPDGLGGAVTDGVRDPQTVDGGLLAAGCLLVERARQAATGSPD